ncbi:hypothetical protein MSAN_01740900 [Mycena sanguinolenta]|uniref:Uncharacterized protein n=1 Tax=Mycena sanguinolenta TaxID=230812 RepID=A0A8H6Y0D8_9AGAR|nr:hypothetical protein MSAN_01740900 [Mycena sanguinolenta]
MHTVLEGLVHYHCCRVLKLNLLDAKKFDKSPPAYQYDFPSLDAAAPADWDMTKDIHQKSVEDIYKLLVYQISENEDSSEDENGEEDDEGEEEEEAEDEDVRKAKAKAKVKKRKRDKDELTSQILAERLERQYKISLAWVCYQLELPKVIPSSVPPIIRKNPKKAAKTAKKKKKDVPEEPLMREKYLI